ncbi:MAG: putative toxin-antitoxin system toxin component, PIN family [Nanoarchaeota archaeon]|nr:putative toxin-antitoxin system toxin component, PIN family [Nanoarchaeota archaeon]
MKVTLDTNVLISATHWPTSVAHKLFLELIRRNVEMVTTQAILSEFTEVLVRDFNYQNHEVEQASGKMLAAVKIIESPSRVNIVHDDPDDNKIIECAIDSFSDYILTYDNHLLVLKEFQGIKIIKPEDFLRIELID